MGKLAVLKNIFLIVLLVGVVFMVSHYAEPVKNMALGMIDMQDESVLGASSKRAEEITDKVGSDIGAQLVIVQQQALKVTLGDVVTTLTRLQKIPQDFHAVREFIKDQADNVLQSTK